MQPYNESLYTLLNSFAGASNLVYESFIDVNIAQI